MPPDLTRRDLLAVAAAPLLPVPGTARRLRHVWAVTDAHGILHGVYATEHAAVLSMGAEWRRLPGREPSYWFAAKPASEWDRIFPFWRRIVKHEVLD